MRHVHFEGIFKVILFFHFLFSNFIYRKVAYNCQFDKGVRIRAMESFVIGPGNLIQVYATECDDLIFYK